MSPVSGVFRTDRARAGRGLWIVALTGLALGCVEQAEDKPTKEDEEFVKQNLLTTAPTPQFVTNANLDGKVEYLGLDVSPTPVEPGKDVRLTHYWKVITPPGDTWRTFYHIGPTRQRFLNVDHGPVNGKYPVSRWKAGEIIRDQHSFRMPADFNFPTFNVYVGLWRGKERMAVKSGPREEDRVLAATVPVKTRETPAPLRYLARRTLKPIKIDGKLDEAAWKNAPSTGAFVSTLTGASAEPKTEAKLLWDNQFLYIAFENVDKDVWSELANRDDKLWTQEAVEVMIDANGDGKGYIELQVAPNGNVLDTYLPSYRKYEDSLDPKRKPFDWTSKLKAAVKVDGTLNKRGDEDKGWTVEMALPLADANGLDTAGVKVPPALGDVWRLNMFRMDQAKDKPQVAVGWSAPYEGDFHKLSRFGELVFGDDKGEVPAKAAPKAEEDKPQKGKEKEDQSAQADKAKGDKTAAGKVAKADKKEEKK